MSGIRLDAPTFWEVAHPRKDAAAFVRALPELLPSGAALYLEGGCPSGKVRTFLQSHQLSDPAKVARGTIWPTPECFHVPLTLETAEGLAALFETHATPEICVHFHAYANNEILLQWHDAFFGDPIFLSVQFAEERVRTFAEKLGATFALSRQEA